MKIEKLIKGLFVILAVTALNAVAMEKEGKSGKTFTLDDIKNNYLLITNNSQDPLWIRVRNSKGQAYVEKGGRSPVVSSVSSSIRKKYENSVYSNRILVLVDSPVLIPLPYNEKEFPLRIRVWTYENKDNNDDNSSALSFYLDLNDVVNNEGQAIRLHLRAPWLIDRGLEKIYGFNVDNINQGKAKILTLETEEVH